MKLYIVIQSFNDIITNSSTEILGVKTEYTLNMLKELILNYAILNDSEEEVCSSDVHIEEFKIDDLLKELYGVVNEEEIEKFNIIVCKRIGIDPKKSGKLYKIFIEKHLYKTIEFLEKTLGAI